MADQSNKPSIRFAGFTDPWEQRKLDEVAASFDYGLNAAATTYDGENGYLRITDIDDSTRQFSKSDLTSPDVDLAQCQDSLLHEGDIVFARTGASVGKTYIYREYDGVTYFAGFLIRMKVKSGVVPQFVFQATLSETYKRYVDITSQRSGQPGVNAEEYADCPISVPSFTEQQAVGSFFSRLDDLITLHQRKYDKLVVFKKAMLEQMFPQEGETVPKIRFAGFTDPWEQRKLGEVVDQFKELVPTPQNGYVRMGVRSHAKGTFLTDVDPGAQIEEKELCRVAPNNLVVNIVFAWEHAVAITSENDAVALVSHRFPQFSFHEDMSPNFFRFIILDGRFRHHLWLASPSGAGRNKTLNVKSMLEYGFVVPHKEEQQKIGNFFSRLDSLITLHQRKLELLQNIKKSLLDEMFV